MSYQERIEVTGGQAMRNTMSYIEPEARSKKLLWLAGAVVLLLIGGGAYYASTKSSKPASTAVATEGDDKKDDKKQTAKISVIVPGQNAVATEVSITGTLAARYEMPVGPEGEGGRIAQVYAEAGDRVSRGQLLVRLNTDLLRPQVAQLTASLEEARANAELAQADYARAKSVADTGAISREELDRRRATAATAKARANVVAAQLKEGEARLARSDIRAPAAGIVLERKAEIGQTANGGGEPLFRLAQGGQIELRGQIAEQDLPKVRIGQTVSVRLSGVDQAFEGKIWQLGAIIDPRTRQGSARIELASNPMLRPGAFAQATISAGGGIRPVLPQSALQSDAKGTYVFVVSKDRKVERRDVKVSGASAKGVIIAEGLSGQEQVVATAAAFLRAGETVDPVIKRES
jgi:HlyD family secretion protein